MKPSVLVVASRALTLLGLAQALRRLGYLILTSFPDEADLASSVTDTPSVVLVRPPSEPDGVRRCMELIKALFLDRGVPVVAWSSTESEAGIVREYLAGSPIVIGEALRLEQLSGHIQDLLGLPPRQEMRITTDIVVAHRAPALSPAAGFQRSTMTSLSLGGCFIQSPNPYPVGSTLELLIPLSSELRDLKIVGTVSHHGVGEGQQDRGMGVRFENLSEGNLAALESLMTGELGAAYLSFP